MAKIPTLGGSPRLRGADPLAPTLSPGEAAAPFRQIGNLASQVAGSMFELRRKQQAEADKVSYTKNNIALGQSFNEVSGQMEEEYRTNKPNYEGYADDAMDRMEVHKTFILEQTPDSAKASTTLAFDQKMAQMKEKFQGTESNKKSEYAMIETKGTIDDLKNASYSNWDPMGSLESSSRLKGLVATSSQYDQRGKQVLLGQIENVNKDMINGVLDRENPVEMRQALADLNSEDLAPVFGQMDPKVITKAKVKLARKLEYKNVEGLKEVRRKFSDSISGLQNGTLLPNNPQHQKILSNVKNEIQTRMGEDGGAFIDKIEAYEMAAEISSDRAFEINDLDPESASREISSDIADPLRRAGSQGAVKGILTNQKVSMQKELAKDPASYLMKHDSGIALSAKELVSSRDPSASKEFMTSMDSRYDQLGTPGHQRKYLPKVLREHYGKSINRFIDSGDSKSAAAVMNDLSARFGDDLGKVYDELEIPKKYEGVSEIQDPDARTRVMKNLMNEEEDINPRYKGHKKQIKDTEIKSALRNSDMYKSIMGQDGGSNSAAGKNAESMLGIAQVEYKLAILNGSDKDEAEVQAWDKVSSQYEFLDNGANPIAINTRNHQPQKAEQFLKKFTKAGGMDYVNQFDLKVHDESSMEATNNQFQNKASWTYNKKSDSMRLVIHENGSYRKALTREGKEVTIPLSAIDKMEDLGFEPVTPLNKRDVFLPNPGRFK